MAPTPMSRDSEAGFSVDSRTGTAPFSSMTDAAAPGVKAMSWTSRRVHRGGWACWNRLKG